MQPLTPAGFHTLSEQNSRLNQNLIQVTLSHQSLVQENTKLNEQVKKKDYALIEATLRQKNANHMLESVKKEYEKLQNEYKELFDWMRSEKKVEMRELFKRESQLAIDMAFIEGESYREGQKAKNEQIAKYQERLITLVRENQDLKTQILQTTSQYNSKLYLQQQTITEQELRINSLESKISLPKPTAPATTLPTLQLQLQLQNTRQKLQLYIKENEAIGKMNLRLREENDSLFKELKEVRNVKKQVEDEDETMEGVSVDVMMGLRRENEKLRKEIEDISNKYQLLAETFPGLVQDEQALLELQQNIQTQAQTKKLSQQLKQSTLKCQSLQTSLSHLQQKLLTQTKTRQQSQLKTSLLIKRFNEMFIRMNPYFDIYKYDMLEFDEKQFEFFDKNKDYRQLKEYEALVARLKREVKEHQLKAEFKERDLNEIIREKDNTVERLEKQLEQTTLKLDELTEANSLLKSNINQNQLLEQTLPNKSSDQLVYQKSLQNQVTLPLMQQLILQLQQQRQQLFQTIFLKDNEIASLLTKLQESTVTVQPVVLPEVKLQATVGSLQVNEHIVQLVRQNEEQEKRFNERIEELRRVIQEYQVKLNHQHDLYRLEVMQYQNDYQKKLAELNQRVLQWTNNCESLKQLLLQKELNEALNSQQNPSHQPNPIQEQPHPQGQIPIARHPSQSHLEHIPIQTSQPTSSNNLIGESTVQNLTAIIKKYEQQMNEVLSMCAKLSQEYSQLKNKLKDHQSLQRTVRGLNEKVHSLSEEIKLKDKTIHEKNNSLKTIEQLYSAKETHCEELKKEIIVQSKLMEASVREQKQRNELLTKQLSEIKERFYQIASKPSQQPNQNAIMNKSEFETIVVMHANKNKEISQLAEKNKLLENKVEILMKELNLMKLHSIDKKPQDLSPLEKVEMKQLASLLQQTNIFELIKQANSIIEKEKQKSVEEHERMNEEPNQKQ